MPKKKHEDGWWIISIPKANGAKVRVGPMSKPRTVNWLTNNGFSRKGNGWCMKDETQLGLVHEGKIVRIAFGETVELEKVNTQDSVHTCETYRIRGRPAKAAK